MKIFSEEEREIQEIMDMFRIYNQSSVLPGISRGDFIIMRTIWRCMQENHTGIVKVAEIVKSVQTPAPAVSRSFRMLEGKGYIVRSIDEKDRRNVCVELTEEGKQVFLESEEIMNSFAKAVFDKMGQEDVKKLSVYLKKFFQISKDEIDKRKMMNGEEI